MTEDDLFRHLKKHVRGAYKRIENTAGAGILDVYATIRGYAWLIELKIETQGRCHLTKAQYNFGRTHQKNGAQNHVALIQRQEPTLYHLEDLLDVAIFAKRYYHIYPKDATPMAEGWEDISLELSEVFTSDNQV